MTPGSTASSGARALEAWVREECAAQQRLAALLEEELDALVRGRPARIGEGAARLEREAAHAAVRAARRDRIVRTLAAEWNVAPRTLTLGSAAERLGAEGATLRGLRAELRGAVARVARLARRMTAQARYQERLFGEWIETLLAAAAPPAPPSLGRSGTVEDARGSLVDAEA